MSTTDSEQLRAIVAVSATDGVRVRTNIATVEPGQCDFAITRGVGYPLRVIWFDDSETVVDLSAGTASFVVRKQPDSTTNILALTQLTGVTLAAPEPNITVSLSAANVTTIIDGVTDGAVAACWWLYVTVSSVTRCLLRGSIALREGN